MSLCPTVSDICFAILISDVKARALAAHAKPASWRADHWLPECLDCRSTQA